MNEQPGSGTPEPMNEQPGSGTLEPMYKEHSQQQADTYEVLLKVLKSSQSSNRYKDFTMQPSATKQRK